jgi:hypothetical protein
MIKPDGSMSHDHIINNFTADNVIITDKDVVITGIADISSNGKILYPQVPLMIHLMGMKVLGLTIDVSKTEGHFSGSSEMFGTLISGVGLHDSDSNNIATTIYQNNNMSNHTSMENMKMMH